ncbi:MAG TPA: hypothetical protein VJ840_13685 [Gemmatimonadaceae bacterium]|nr:hypothetical protein [Gemmatimonadaceae bacterium]
MVTRIAGVIRPRNPKLRDVGAVYLVEIRVASITGIAAGGFPVSIVACRRTWWQRSSA